MTETRDTGQFTRKGLVPIYIACGYMANDALDEECCRDAHPRGNDDTLGDRKDDGACGRKPRDLERIGQRQQCRHRPQCNEGVAVKIPEVRALPRDPM